MIVRVVRCPPLAGNLTLRCVGTLITWPYTSGGSRCRSPKAGTKYYESYLIFEISMRMHHYHSVKFSLSLSKNLFRSILGKECGGC